MRNTQIEEKVSHFRAQAIDALSAAIKEESDLTKLNTQFLYFRKMDQLAQHIIQNPYNGNTRQRIEAHAVLKHEIINKYNDCIQYPLKAIDSHSSLEKVYNQEITKIKVDYARNSMTQYSAYKYTLGLLFGESSSKTASKLNKAGEEADNINQTNMLDFK